jgi:hypothetical protein
MSRTDGGHEQTEHLDAAIDRAVREMLDVEPPAGLRGRVLDRLERPRRGLGWMWIAAPIAAAAVIVLAVMLPWRGEPWGTTPAPRVMPAPQVAVTASPQAPLPAPSSSPLPRGPLPSPRAVVRPSGPQRLVSAARPAGEGTLSAAMVPPSAESDAGIDPLAPIAPITVAVVRPVNITPTEIVVSPLAPITELQIAPLSPPDRRN